MTENLPLVRVRKFSLRPEEVLGVVLVLISRVLTMPRSPWELDELLFTRAVIDFEPLHSRPHPPGYPLLVGLGKVVNLLVADPWRALVVLSVIASVIGFVALARAATLITGSRVTGCTAALLFYFSSAMLVHGTLALSDATMLMFTALALWLAARYGATASARDAALFAVALSGAIGTRPQMAIALVPVFALVVATMRSWRHRFVAVLCMTIASLLWFVPLIEEAEGWESFAALQAKQAAYFAEHDAAESRGVRSIARLVGRFIFYPWEPKIVAFPIMFLALFGTFRLVRRRRSITLPVALLAVIHGGFALAAMDPADGPRYILPAMLFVAIAAAEGVAVIHARFNQRFASPVVVLFVATASLVFAAPILVTRTRIDSPPVQAAAYIRANYPPETVVLFDGSLHPHVDHLLGEFASRPTEAGLSEFYDDGDVPLVHLADGGSHVPGAKSFSWPASDAYTRLTRKHYRVVSLEPVPSHTRFKPLRDVSPPERLDTGLTWRWLGPEARIELPPLNAGTVRLTFAFSPDTPYESNAVQILTDGRLAASLTVTRDSGVVDVPLEPGARILDIRSDRSFIPADVIGNGDRRRLAVQLRSLEQR